MFIVKIRDEMGLAFTEKFSTISEATLRVGFWLDSVDECPLDELMLLDESGEMLIEYDFSE